MHDTYIMKRTQIYLEADQDRRLATRATASGVTKSTLIREAIETYLAIPGDADKLAQFRAAVDAVVAAPPRVPDGETYVESIRAADVARQAKLDERRSVLLDTSVVIDILRGAGTAIAFARGLPEPPICHFSMIPGLAPPYVLHSCGA